VTQHSKSREYFDTYYNDGNLMASWQQMEFKEKPEMAPGSAESKVHLQ
jgi:hypothetical protein